MRPISLAVWCFACGCVPTAPLPPARDGGPATDAPLVARADAPTGDSRPDAPSGCAPAPATVLGTEVGATVPDFILPRCDGSPFAFYDGGFCASDHRATVLIFAALWCTRCQDESARLESEITQVYRDRGVRVVQVLVDGAIPGTAVTGADCARWVATYGLTSEELFDAGGAVTSAFYPSRTFPSTLLVDADGIIRYRSVGASDGLPALAEAIDGVTGP